MQLWYSPLVCPAIKGALKKMRRYQHLFLVSTCSQFFNQVKINTVFINTE